VANYDPATQVHVGVAVNVTSGCPRLVAIHYILAGLLGGDDFNVHLLHRRIATARIGVVD
jgi:hypothetical protein